MFKIEKTKIESITKTKDHGFEVFKAAKYYAAEGFPVIPLRKNSKVLPRANQGVSYRNATTDMAQIIRWFDPTEGLFVGWNIGICCGGTDDGILVVDIDTSSKRVKGEAGNGFPQWYALISENKTYETIVQETPSGGQHWLFRGVKGAKSNDGVLGAGIDIRAGIGSIKSHIVAYPSTIDGKQYKWKTFGELTTTPDWLIDQLNIQKNSKPTDNKPDYIGDGNAGNELVADDDLPIVFTEADVIKMLGFIPIDTISYTDWFSVGVAIHSEYSDSRGLEIWDNWSKSGNRYKPNECSSRWKGFDEPTDGTPITMGTLVYLAQSFGFTINNLVPKDSTDPAKEIDVVSQINSNCFVNLGTNSFRICIESDHHLRTLSRADFIHHYENQKVLVGRKLVSPANIWLSSSDRRELKGYRFSPHQTIDECEAEGYYNLFRGFPFRGEHHNTEGIDLFLDFIKKVISNNNDKVYEWILDWFADIIQNPSDPKGTALVLVGDEGIGKGVIVKIFSQILGRYFCKDVAGTKIAGKFNGFLENSLLLFADEMTRTTGIKVQQTLKALITGEELLLESKGLDVKNTKLMARLIIASNDLAVIRGERTSRRYLSLEVSNSHINDHNYFSKLFKSCSGDKFCEDLMFFFESRDLTNTSHLRKAPVTSLLERQKISNIMESNNVVLWLYTCIDTQAFGINDLNNHTLTSYDWLLVASRVELRKEYEAWCLSMRKQIASPVVYYEVLRKVGFKDKRFKKHGKVYRAFEVPSMNTIQELIGTYMGVDWATLDGTMRA